MSDSSTLSVSTYSSCNNGVLGRALLPLKALALAIVLTSMLDLCASVLVVKDLRQISWLGFSFSLTTSQAIIISTCAHLSLIVLICVLVWPSTESLSMSTVPCACAPEQSTQTPVIVAHSCNSGSAPGPTSLLNRSKSWLAVSLCVSVASLAVVSVLSAAPTYWRILAHDVLINQEILPPTSQQLRTDPSMLSDGQREMRGSDVTFVGVGRDVAGHLANLLPQIDALASEFSFSQAVFLEGDSSDDTWKILQDWSSVSPLNRTILQVPSAHFKETVPTFQGQGLPREGRLAFVRNQVLNAVNGLKRQTKYLIVVDMDILGWNPLGVQDSFGRRDDWDVMCANGVVFHGVYRDTYAFRRHDIDNNHHKGGRDHDLYNITKEQRVMHRYRHMIAKRKTQQLMNVNRYFDSDEYPEPIEVSSCFGGLAIYRTRALQGCRYESRQSFAPYMLDCEHVLFHNCLKETNNAKIFSNPNMKLWYGHTNLRNIHYDKVVRNIFS